VGTALVDEVVLRIPAHSVLRADERALPVGVDRVESSGYDFRVPRAIGSTVLDHCFTGLERAADGLAHVELRDPRSDVAATLWCDAAYPYVMVFTGDRPDVARRSLAVEPMTCPPNAFRSGGSLIVLEPGASHVGVWGIAPSSGSERTPNRTTAHQGTHF
jgi:aldose 1-epimerase